MNSILVTERFGSKIKAKHVGRFSFKKGCLGSKGTFRVKQIFGSQNTLSYVPTLGECDPLCCHL